MAQPLVGEMEMHSVANLATVQTPLVTFFPLKKAPKPSFWESQVLPRKRKVLLSQRGAHTSLSLRLLSFLFSDRQRESSAFIQLNTDIMDASLILHASIAEITAQLLSLSYVYLLSSDDGAIIMIFCAD